MLHAGLQFQVRKLPGVVVNSIAVASELLRMRQRRRQVPPYSAAQGGLNVDQAYEVAAEILKVRKAAGETPVGRKIGFTNRNIWPEYGVSAPIWGYVYDATLRMAHANHGVQSLRGSASHGSIDERCTCKYGTRCRH